jgi:hypothetical protein
MSNSKNILYFIRNNKLNELKFYLEYNTFDYECLNHNFVAVYSQQQLSYEMIKYFINEMKFTINHNVFSYAIKYKQIDVIEFLLKKNDLCFSDSILDEAVKSNNSTIVNLFIDNKWIDNCYMLEYPLLIALEYNCVNSLYSLLESKKFEPEFNNNTLIHRALLSKKMEIIKILLKEEQVKELLINEQKELYYKINTLLAQDTINNF